MKYILVFVLIFPMLAYASSPTKISSNKENSTPFLSIENFLEALEDLNSEPLNPQEEKLLNQQEKKSLLDRRGTTHDELINLIFDLKNKIVDLEARIIELENSKFKR